MQIIAQNKEEATSVEDDDFSNTVDEHESPDMGGFNELSEPNY